MAGCLVLDLRTSGTCGPDLRQQLRATGADIPLLVEPFPADTLLVEILAALN
jgi:FixJ family two-component response regulator